MSSKALRNVRGGLAALVVSGIFAAFAGCGDAGHKGELMVIFQTDMSLPKDIDSVRIEIRAYGEAKFDKVFDDLGTDGALKLPGTIGVLVGEDATTPVTMRITGFQDGRARVLREAVSTVPEDRLVQLRLPVQWLCDGSAIVDESGQVKSACGEGLTCVAGSCVPVEVDSSELPDYEEESIFGGGTGDGDGACFDTANCMRGFSLAPLIDGSCAASVGGNVNIAIQTQGDGICGPAGCFIQLDANSEAGWKRSDDSTIALPQGFCDKLATGEIVGIAATPVTDACPLKDETLPTCGPWSNTGGEVAPPGVDEPVALAVGQDHPSGLVSDGTKLYWTNRGTFGQPDSTLKNVSLEGGTPATMLANLASARDLAIDGSTLYFTLSGLGAADGKVYSLVPGNTATDLIRDGDDPLGVPQPEGVAAHGVNVFFTTFGEGGIYFARSDGGSIDGGPSFRRVAFADAQSYPYRVDFDSTYLYGVNEGTAAAADGAVMSAAIADLRYDAESPTIALASGEVVPRAMKLDLAGGENAVAVYYTTFSEAGEIKRAVPGLEDAPTTLATGQSFPNGVTVDDGFIYWTNRGDGTVMRLAKDAAEGTEPTLIASSQTAPGPIVVDATHIYWANEGTSQETNGSIMKIGKPAN
jgi:hypothetical protein